MISIEKLCEKYLSEMPTADRRYIKSHQLKNIIDFSTNDYLNIGDSSLVKHKFQEAIKEHGFGSKGSRLLAGHRKIFDVLEKKIAESKGVESALIFNSGYQANISVVATLLAIKFLGQQAVVFFDKANHSSLYQGTVLAKAHLVPYPHLRLDVLENKLKCFSNDNRAKIVISETLFGMDGDIVDIQKIVQLCKQHAAFLYLDDSHATGILGLNHYGLAHGTLLKEVNYLIMGTFGKALGGIGAYIASSKAICDYLINFCPGFIYSTSLPPAAIEVISFIWDLIPEFAKQTILLMHRSRWLGNQLRGIGLPVAKYDANIVPIILGENNKVIEAMDKLYNNKILVSAIRSPTVPLGKARLRLAITLKHQKSDLQKLILAMKSLYEGPLLEKK